MADTLTIFNSCTEQILCPGSDYPVSNFSSEASDGPEFIAMQWPGNGGECVGMGESLISLAEAQLCAALSSATCGDVSSDPGCIPPIWPIVPITPHPGLFHNDPQSCTVSCANGSQSTYTIAAGRVANASQATANQIAASLACQFAYSQNVCMVRAQPPGHPTYDPLNLVGDNGYCCAGETLTGESMFEVTGSGLWNFTASGQLPTGTSLQQDSNTTAALNGTLDVPGIYNFTVQADHFPGQSVSQNFTVHLIGLQSPTLPDGAVGTPYNQQVVALGVVMPVTFTPVGPLPPGLTMDTSGNITGTPTTPGTY